MIKGVTHAHLGPIWYHKCPLFPKPVSWFGLFFAVSYSKQALKDFISILWIVVELAITEDSNNANHLCTV